MRKRLMILGASQLQLPAIKIAKDMGVHVIVLDANENAIGKAFADEFYKISTIDIAAIKQKAVQCHIDGIMTLATDMPMRAVAEVGCTLGLKTISIEAATVATNKGKMRQRFKEYGVPIPMFKSVKCFEEYVTVVNEIQGKKIVKPTDSSGSRGVYLLEREEDILEAYEHSMNSSLTGEIIVEEYMQGSEVSVETITLDGKTNVIAITDKITTGAPHFVELGHSIPSMQPNYVQEEIKKVAIKAIEALKIDNSPAHTEIIITNEGPKIVEVGARLGGDNITAKLVPLATGVDMVTACIDMALGEKTNIRSSCTKGAAIKFIKSHEGYIERIEGMDAVNSVEGVKEVFLSKSIGELVGETKSSVDRLGYVISQSDTANEANKICERAISNLKVVIKENSLLEEVLS